MKFAIYLSANLFVALIFVMLLDFSILGDPGANSGGEGKSKRAEKYGTKET